MPVFPDHMWKAVWKVFVVEQNRWSIQNYIPIDPQIYCLSWVNLVFYLILSYLEIQMLSRCACKKKKKSAISYESWETHTTNIIFLKSNWKTIFVRCAILVSVWHVLWPVSWKQSQAAVRCPCEEQEGVECAKAKPTLLRTSEVKLALIFSIVHVVFPWEQTVL